MHLILNLQEDLKAPLRVVGRIPPATLWDYLKKISKSHEILVFNMVPRSKEDQTTYDTYANHLKTRERFGVVEKKCLGEKVKDCYIVHSLDSSSLSLDSSIFEEDLLSLLVVRMKRKRPPALPTKRVAKKSTIVNITDDDIFEMSEKRSPPLPAQEVHIDAPPRQDTNLCNRTDANVQRTPSLLSGEKVTESSSRSSSPEIIALSSPDVINDTPCVFFQSGSCRKGRSCNYLHNAPKSGQQYVEIDEDDDEFDDYVPA